VAFLFVVDFAFDVELTRSGSFVDPVSLFHSSNVSAEIWPFTRSSANFLRWAWLLNGMSPPAVTRVSGECVRANRDARGRRARL
jgi:hypothetical protein